MTCGVLPNRPISLEYAELNMEYTSDMHMRAVAADVSVFVYAVPLALIAAAELVIKNGLFLMYNAAVFVINGASWLACKVVSVATSYFDGGAIFSTNQQIALIGTDFTADDLVTFKAALSVSGTSAENPTQVFLEHLVYSLWYDQGTQTVHIRDMNQPDQPTLSLRIIEGGHVASIQLDGVEQAAFPEAFAACMFPCFMKSLELSSTYIKEGDLIQVRVIRRGLHEIAEHHLAELGRDLNVGARVPAIGVRFLKDDLTEDQGIDAGGLRRDYFDDLFKGLVKNKGEVRFTVQRGTDLHMPVAQEEYRNHRVPDITQLERPIYRNMGAAMMFSQRSGLLIGRRFEEALFRAAFSLTPAEVDARFTDLQPATLLKMARAIFEAREMNTQVFDILTANVEEIDWAVAVAIAETTEGWPDNFEFEDGNVHHQNQVLQALRDLVYGSVGRYLAPIHSIAKGINDAKRRWHINDAIDWRVFSDAVQGRSDPATIAASLRINEGPAITQHIRDKVQWIREWLVDPETDPAEVREFVKFATGSSSLANGAQIGISCQHDQFIPAAVGHSCFSTIDLSPRRCSYGEHNDHTKANFIRALRELSLTQAGNYFMG